MSEPLKDFVLDLTYVPECLHSRVGFAQTKRIVYCPNGDYSPISIADAVPYCLDCGRSL